MYCIDQDSDSENVIGITDSMIFIGSCDSDACSKVDQQLSSQVSPIEVLGTEDIITIPFIHLQKLISRSTDIDVDISYQARKEVEEKTLYFSDVDDKQKFIRAIEPYMPESLNKSESSQSAVVAAISPLTSLIFSLLGAYLFIDKLRMTALIIGGLWAAGSAYMLLTRIKQPPTVTRYTMGARYFRKFWGGLKTAGAFALVLAIVFSVYFEFPNSHGPSAIYEHVVDDKMMVSDLQKFLDRGANIDYQGKDGSTALSIALDWGYDDLATALLESGADLSIEIDGYDSLIEYAIYSGSSVSVIEAMLERGASLDIEIDGVTPLEYSRQNEETELEEFIVSYLDTR